MIVWVLDLQLEIKKTEVLMENFRRAIGLRIAACEFSVCDEIIT
jgi:DNA helicase TIP49 (TBP-interacting protein)